MIENPATLENVLGAPTQDYDGRSPGDPGYNVIGARVRQCEATFGIRFQYHPKKGILPELDYSENPKGDPVPISGVEALPENSEVRDRLVAIARKVYARGTNAQISTLKMKEGEQK